MRRLRLIDRALHPGLLVSAVVASTGLFFCATFAASPVGARQIAGRVPGLVHVLEPASSGGIARLDAALDRLTQHRRLLMVAAHPDDEDTRLLAAVARGAGGEAAYLSLSRGEGGQNLIGTELGIGLGLLRSRELESARAVDGAWQMFGGAYDFGYTRSLDETLTRWHRDALIEDVARAIRRFRPQVVVSVWPDSRRAGHGQHWASGVVTPAAFEAAAGTLPGLDAERLEPWRADVLARPAWSANDAVFAEVPFGVLDPLRGRSMLQWAMASRSRHRSQDMGSLEPLGDAVGRYVRIDSDARDPSSTDPAAGLEALFEGVDTRLEALAMLLPEGTLRERAKNDLAEVATLASSARSRLTPRSLDSTATEIGRIVALLAGLEAAVAESPRNHGVGAFHALVAEKRTIADEALASAAGVAVDAFAPRVELLPGTEATITAVLWNAGGRDVGTPVVDLTAASGLSMARAETVEPEGRGRFGGTPTASYRLDVAIADDARPSVPYFLEQPLDGDRYDWRNVRARLRGEPFGPPPLVARFRFAIDGRQVVLSREVVARSRDQARGEVRRPLRVVPAVEIRLDPPSTVWRLGDREGPRSIGIEVTNRRRVPTRLALELSLPPGWRANVPSTLEIESKGTWRYEAAIETPTDLAPGRYEIRAAVVDEAGHRYDRAIDVIDYPHVRPTPRPVAARTTVAVGDIDLGPARRVGYIRGASDRVPEALEGIGVDLTLLDASALEDSDLAGFDTLVVGSRAYETDPALAATNERLLDFARGGGTVIVQYQQYGFAADDAAPYPIEIHRPHDRATDEASSVRVLAPEHPALNVPNAIAESDWQGWVQERGLYFAGTWDDAYTPILALPDPEGVERSGALLVSRLGEGWYVYTGLAFFRQLPAGVVGAFRLFANLLALGTEDG